MWIHDKIDFFDYLHTFKVRYNSPVFLKRLQEKGLEKKKRLIRFYIPDYIPQLNLPISYVTEYIETLPLIQDFEYDDGSYEEIQFPIEVYKMIPVDSNVFTGVCSICKKYNLNGHEEQIASLLKMGYFNYTMAEVKMMNEESMLSHREFSELVSMAFSGQEIYSIKFSPVQGKSKELKSDMLKEIITNSIASFLFANLKYGEILTVLDEMLSKVDLHIKYRNLTLFFLVCYLFREVGLIKLNREGKVTISKENAELLAELLELAQIPLIASTRKRDENQSPSSDDTLIRRCFTSAIEVFPILERFLYKGAYTEQELEGVNDNEEKQKNELARLENYKSRFIKKEGL